MDKYLSKAKHKLNGKLQEFMHSPPAHQGQQHHHHPHNGHPPPIPPKPQIPITSQQAGDDRPSTIQPPTPLDVLRYRHQHGANLGAVYVLEKWLFPGMFPGSCHKERGRSSELEAVRASVAELGVEGARHKFEAHWEAALTDADLDWLVGVAKCNTIRLPIGYFTLGPAFCASTPFAPYAAVYARAWPSVKRLVARARARGVGTLVDLHGLPGGANGCEHSGTNSGSAEHWRSPRCRDQSLRCLAFVGAELASDAGFGAGVVGVAVCNEAEWEAPGLYEWYEAAARAVAAAADPRLPVYVSDAWDLGRALEWCGRRNGVWLGAPPAPVVVDTHLYWAFAEQDRRKSPQEVVAEAGRKLGALDGREGDVLARGAVAVVVGEYSCVLSEDSWKRKGERGREELVREFGQALSRRFQQRAMGSHFWTYKMQWMPGGEWGFKACTEKGAITPHRSLTLSAEDVSQRLESAQQQRETRFSKSFSQHCGYWDRTSPEKQFEHWRYEQGWKLGFDDAAAFFGMRANGGFGGDLEKLGEGGAGGGVGGDRIGSLDVWVRKRLLESGMTGPYVWEFEQGLRKGVKEFCELAGGL